MAIKITALTPDADGSTGSTSGAIYTDLHFDYNYTSNNSKQQLAASNTANDLQVDTNYKAISNSLLNIFNTSPGEKILNPRFGADLRKYLFEPITEPTANVIGDVIVQAIDLYEPRVNIEQVVVIPFPDQNEYLIAVYLTVPAIPNETFKFEGTLSQDGVRTTTY